MRVPDDEMLAIFVPIIIYWLYSGLYSVMAGSMDNHRLFVKEEEEESNLVTRGEVVKGVLLQQALQIALLSLTFKFTGSRTDAESRSALSSAAPAIAGQLVIAVLVIDAWQYWVHRTFHMSSFLYRHFHSRHHRLVVPYAFGAMYSHPVDVFITDVVGGTVTYMLSGMSPRVSIFFFSVLTTKNIDDHCGMWFPSHPFHCWFSNNSAFHAVHHQLYGVRFNFSSLFLTVWDKLLGTDLPYTVVKRENGAGWELLPQLLDEDPSEMNKPRCRDEPPPRSTTVTDR